MCGHVERIKELLGKGFSPNAQSVCMIPCFFIVFFASKKLIQLFFYDYYDYYYRPWV
jgi:hypothetical protein